MKMLLAVALGCAINASAAMAETKWVDANGAACPQTCSDQSMFAVGAGVYKDNANRYYRVVSH